MILMLTAVLTVAGLVLAIWIAAVLVGTDLSIPKTDTHRFKNVLAIFPHADDETINCGGAIHRFSARGASMTLLLLTRGERGNPSGVPDDALKETRDLEAKTAAAILGVSRLIQQDFGDGQLASRKAELKAYLEQTIEVIQPDLILTFDLSGFYGHPDHVTCAESLTELHAARFESIPLWYVAIPRRLRIMIQFTGQLRSDARLDARRAAPSVRIFIGSAVIPKIRAWYAYRSQRGSLAKGLGRLIPMWFVVSALQFEYFAEAS